MLKKKKTKTFDLDHLSSDTKIKELSSDYLLKQF